MMFHVPEKHRYKAPSPRHKLYSDESYGNNGVFEIGNCHVIASDGGGWDHVSVSTRGRPPRWNEMCVMKNYFWDVDDCVVQFHPPESEYVNDHPNTLHLWRWQGGEFPRPAKVMV